MFPAFQMDDKFGSENKAKIVIQHNKLKKSKDFLTTAVFHFNRINIS